MNNVQRYNRHQLLEVFTGPGRWCKSEDVAELEFEYAAVVLTCFGLYDALRGLTNPQPDDVYADLMNEAIAAVHAFQNDDSQGVTVELPYDFETEPATINGEQP